MNKPILLLGAGLLFEVLSSFSFLCNAQGETAFQTNSPWKPTLNVQADIAIVYGTNDKQDPCDKTRMLSFEERVQSWKKNGYALHFMTGIAWGEYQDYFNGKWDGKKHNENGQIRLSGDTIWHEQVPYVVPSNTYINYIKETQIKRAIDAGIDDIILEEPEFWAFAGYSEQFKHEWKLFYHENWKPQHESAENLYLSNKLKLHLYYQALQECLSFAKSYGKTKGRNIHCYVATHSLINYSQWQIISPESELALLDCVDGYIAQVWTGTSRVPNFYQGKYGERVFETAFLEYGALESMTTPTRRKIFFLTDPIEDGVRDWKDYLRNYRATYIAQMLYPQNNNFEVMPWPERIYESTYQVSANDTTHIHIPRDFATQMQIMIHASNNMPCSSNSIDGSKGLSVLMSNSLMLQRNDIPIQGYEDPQLSNFFGLALPFVKRGVPLNITQIENLRDPNAWEDTKVLMMTYSNMKPLRKEMNEQIAQWVKEGGSLIYISRDKDPFQTVREWWNTDGLHFKSPADHLFQLLNIKEQASEGIYRREKGNVLIIRKDPKEFVLQANQDSKLVKAVAQLYQKTTGEALQFKNHLCLQRGNYILASVMNESVSSNSLMLKGSFVDLFDENLAVITQKEIPVGEQAFLFDLKKVSKAKRPVVIAAASSISEEQFIHQSVFKFTAKAPIQTQNIMRIWLPFTPKSIKANLHAQQEDTPIPLSHQWDTTTQTLLLRFDNQAKGVDIVIQ